MASLDTSVGAAREAESELEGAWNHFDDHAPDLYPNGRIFARLAIHLTSALVCAIISLTQATRGR